MDGGGPRLRRELNIGEAIGISVALMAASTAADINEGLGAESELPAGEAA